ELPGSILLDVGYLGNISRHIESLRAVNEAIPACPSKNARPGCETDPLAGLSVPLRSPFPNFGRIQLVDHGNRGSYNGLNATVTKPFPGGFTYRVSYRLAKSIDTATAIRTLGGDTLFPQDSYCRNCEKALSAHDTRHRFTTGGTWDLPIGKGRKVNVANPVANTVAGGWQLRSSIVLQSGLPITATHRPDTPHTGALF